MQDELFGAIAVRKKYIHQNDVEKALEIQRKLDRNGKHKLIGLIMLEEGILSSAQLLDILKDVERQQKETSRYY